MVTGKKAIYEAHCMDICIFLGTFLKFQKWKKQF